MERVIIETKQGKIKGKCAQSYNGKTFYSYQGIPYAKAPTGNLRFKAPVPPDNWSGIKDATIESSESLSKDIIYQKKIVGSEDCLYLNVYTPQIPDNKTGLNKPVMVWIHGGAFVYGSSKTDMYGPDYLLIEDIILVTINYRLGILGFLSLEDTSLGVPGNAGLKDIVQSLKWVQENIQNFGGDPKNVTIFGESAGAAACHFLILSPMAKGLFHRAILQSGCALNPWAYGSKNAIELAKTLEFNSTNERDILNFLQTVSPAMIMEAQAKFVDSIECDKLRPFSPVIEKPSAEPAFITKNPIDIIASGNYNKVPIMIGYTDREGMITELSHMKIYGSLQILDDFETKIPYYYNIPKGSEKSKKIAKQIQDFYFGCLSPDIENIDNFFKLETDVLFYRGIYLTIRQHLETMNSPIYLYRFTADTNLNILKRLVSINRPGASHADDLGYLFKTAFLPEIEHNSIEEKLMLKVVKLWTNFAKTGNPNAIEDVTWVPVQKDKYHFLDIGKYIYQGSNPDIDRMKFWNDISSNKLLTINSKL